MHSLQENAVTTLKYRFFFQVRTEWALEPSGVFIQVCPEFTLTWTTDFILGAGAGLESDRRAFAENQQKRNLEQA